MMAYIQPSYIYHCWPEVIDITVWVCAAINDPVVRIFS